MTNTSLDAEVATTSPEQAVSLWLEEFERTIATADAPKVMGLFSSSPMWKDLYALTWDITPFRGRRDLERFIAETVQARTLTDLAVHRDLPAAADDDGVITAMFSFRTDTTSGVGVLRLVPENDKYVAWSVTTELRDLVEHPRPVVQVADAACEEYNVLLKDSTVGQRHVVDDYMDHDPAVLIIGGGQAGLILAARLGEEGVDTLVVDKYERAGDSWRQRYDNLRLHDSKWYSQLPYLPFPPSWPLFSTKDGMADWLELFTTAMAINLWTKAPAVSASYDASTEQWEVTVDRDGERRMLRPRHLVFATGANRTPAMPAVPGAEDFKGFITHSADYRGVQQFPGEKRVLVVGTGASGMDIAKDSYYAGSPVTLLQRGPCYVMSTRYGVPATFGGLFSESSPPQEVADSLFASFPLGFVSEVASPPSVRALAEQDKDMLDALEAVGFRTTLGPGDAGILPLSLGKGGSYYIDNGAAELISSRKIGLAHGSIARFTETGVVLEDGTEIEVDAVVFATGFANMRESFKPVLGDEFVEENVASVWGLDESGELRTTFRHSGHERLWVFAGGVQQSRFHSRPVAVMIKAVERGVLDPEISVKLKASEVVGGDFTYRPVAKPAGVDS